jgi:hypothetical protein
MCPAADNDLATLGSNTRCTLISLIINFGVFIRGTGLSSIYLFFAGNTNVAAITATRVTASAAA